MESFATSAALPEPGPAISELTAETFNPYVNDVFQLHWSEINFEPVELLSATARPKFAVPGGRVPFTLKFRARSRQFYVPQGLYPLSHAQAGRVELFLVPVGPDETGMIFEAVFN